jgi:hypothetical protein
MVEKQMKQATNNKQLGLSLDLEDGSSKSLSDFNNICQTARHDIQELSTLHSHCSEDFKSSHSEFSFEE